MRAPVIDFLPEVIEKAQKVPYRKGIIVADKGSFTSLTHPIKRTATGRRTPGGFTLIEVVMVALIIGILAVTFAYKYSVGSNAALNVAADQLIADIRYVQAKAMGAGRQQNIQFRIEIDKGKYRLSGEPGSKRLPDGVTISATTLANNTLVFNTLGEPMYFGTDAYETITLASTGGTRALTVYAITGKVE